MNFPRNKRRQLATLDIIESVLHGLGKAGSKNDRDCVKRMWKQRDEIVISMFGRTNFLHSDPKMSNLYARIIRRGVDYVDHEFDRLGMKSNDRVWCNMMCGVLEITRDTIPDRCPENIKQLWSRACGTAYTIYQHQVSAVAGRGPCAGDACTPQAVACGRPATGRYARNHSPLSGTADRDHQENVAHHLGACRDYPQN